MGIADASAQSRRRVGAEKEKRRRAAAMERKERMMKHKFDEEVAVVASKESRMRLKAIERRRSSYRASEMERLISSQESSLDAIKLQTLVPVQDDDGSGASRS